MPRNGTGTYAVPTQFVPQSVIASATMNAQFADLATAITNSIACDGQTNPIANLPMNTFRHTGVAPASGTTSVTGNLSGGRTEYTAGAAIQDNKLTWAGMSTGAANVYAITLAPAITAYADGALYQFKSHQANTSATPTLAVNGLAPVTLVKVNGAGVLPLGIGDIVTSQTVMVRYDGGLGQFILLNPQTSVYGYINIQNIQPSGTASGETLTLSTWVTRTLTTIVTDTTGLVTLSSSQITLPAGTYDCDQVAGVVANTNTIGKSRLYNQTTGVALLYGPTVTSSNLGNGPEPQFLTPVYGRFTLAAINTLVLQTYASNAAASGGYAASISGASEIYSTFSLRKVA